MVTTSAFSTICFKTNLSSRGIRRFLGGNGATSMNLVTSVTVPTPEIGTVPPLFATSTQYTIDDNICQPTKTETLEKAVHKACRSLDVYMEKKPVAAHTRRAFEVLVEMVGEEVSIDYEGIVLDSGCGTGRSTKLLANNMHPRHLVIGVDRSLARLTKTKDNRKAEGDSDSDSENTKDDSASSSDRETYCHRVSKNGYLVRAELVDFWRCCIKQGWVCDDDKKRENADSGSNLKVTHHYMLYPNPYPTKARLSSRWYAHPSFPLILKLGIPTMIIRSNWEGYLNEFAQAIDMANDFYEDDNNQDGITGSPTNLALPYLSSAKKGPAERIDKSIALTNFESKYDNVGESTFELRLERDEI